jgi:hypothetical protein
MRLFCRRAYPREDIHLAAQVIAARGAQPALLHDLSVQGARLSLTHAPQTDEEVIIRWACFAAVGRVAWVEGLTCGLEFDRQLDERVVATTQAASAGGPPPLREGA